MASQEARSLDEGGSAVMDSLPYIDSIHEGYEQYAASLIESEMENSDFNVASVLPPLAPLNFRTPLLDREYQRVSGVEAPEKRSIFGNTKIDPPSENSVAAWEDAIKRVKVELEKERIRGLMLELEKEGVTADQWKKFNAMLSKAQLEPVHQIHRENIDRINMKRQEFQEDKIGKDVHVLYSQYHQLVDKVYQLKRAVAALHHEIALRPQQSST
uniref:Uncharacterized protein n=1 Tax=Entomoneis paludosa TaxID=265537 RepID=A0A7S2YEL2_9STRA|mmetsp:Transcript_29818/g.62311  ORF Transcript_29818/g.62311 Transcript_29818/m.62311 type:complete len:214 (+) Transcript_29818:159-800(+)